MSKAEQNTRRISIERQIKEMSERGTLEMALVSDDHGFCWNSVGNHFDSDVLAALPSVLGDAIQSRRLRLRYFANGKMGFDVDGADLQALLKDAGIMEDPGMAATTGFPAWLLTATQAGSDDSMEFCLASTKARAVIRPIDSEDANLFLVGIFSSRPKDKSSSPDVAGLSAQLERSLSILEGTAQKGQSLPKAEQVSFVLSGLLEADPGIRAAALHMDDGLVVASAVAPGADSETLSAITSGIFHSCRLVGTETLGGAPEQVYFQGENGTLIASAVRSDLILTVLLGSGAQIGVAETLVRHAVVRMARVVAPQALAEAQEV